MLYRVPLKARTKLGRLGRLCCRGAGGRGGEGGTQQQGRDMGGSHCLRQLVMSFSLTMCSLAQAERRTAFLVVNCAETNDSSCIGGLWCVFVLKLRPC